MTENIEGPRDYDAVLGGINIIPATGVVLGGIAGVKRRFASTVAEHRCAAVKEAEKYGKAGLEIAIKALEDEAELVQKTAYLQLRERKEPEVREVLRSLNFYRFFECLDTIKAGEQITLSSTGAKAAFLASNRNIKKVDLTNIKLLYEIPKYPRNQQSFVISSDGEILARGIKGTRNFVEIWQGGELQHSLYGHEGEIRAIAISPDRQTIATGGDDKSIKIWDINSGKLIFNINPSLMWGTHKTAIIRLAFSPNGKIIISSDGSRAIKLWNWHNKSEPRTFNLFGYSIAISPDGQMLAAASYGGTIKILTLDGEVINILEGHSNAVHCMAFSPIPPFPPSQGGLPPFPPSQGGLGGILATGGSHQPQINFWNVRTGELLHSLTGHNSLVNCLAFSPDGQSLISGSGDKTIKVWGVE